MEIDRHIVGLPPDFSNGDPMFSLTAPCRGFRTKEVSVMGTIENLEAMLARGQDSALLRYGLGNEYNKAGRHEEAVAHLSEAVRLDPGYSAAWKLFGMALSAAGRHAEALAAFDRGIAAAEEKGDVQAAKEMAVFRKRARKAIVGSGG